jgi:hypothetical protein
MDHAIMEGGIPCLDKSITKSEVLYVIEHAKANKAAGFDGVLNEMLKSSEPFVIDFLVDLFNNIFYSGNFPEEWSKAILVPVYKSANPSLTSNYRGISIISAVCKCYTSILNRRLYQWLEDNNRIPENQAGFRKGYSTHDHIFVLYSVVQKYLCRTGKKLYVAFIDLQKAFDSVHHEILLKSISGEGISGTFFNAIKCMYRSLSACVRAGNEMSDLFDCPMGVRQGCVLSPTLFSLLINKLAEEINRSGTHGIQLSELIELFILLFADDIALLSDTPGGLQIQLNALKSCCERLKLTVNRNKSKIMVFRNGGVLSKYEKWTYDDVSLEVVNRYCYLGFTFSTKLSPTVGVCRLVAKAKTACLMICRAFQNYNTMTKEVFFKLFDSKVKSILLYASEVWGLHRLNSLEIVHMQACKRFLGVPIRTPNKMVYGDLQRFPLYICSSVRVIKYWIRLLEMSDNRLPKQAYNMLLTLDRNGLECWVTQVRHFLCSYGFQYVWQSQSAFVAKCTLSSLKIRLVDTFIQEWDATLRNSERYSTYRLLKEDFLCLNFIFDVDIYCYRRAFFQLRMNVLPINAVTHMYSEVEWMKMCPWCPTHIEDARHFVYDCTLYSDLRSNICSYVSEVPFKMLLNGKNIRITVEIAKFSFLALKLRQRALH